MGAITGRMMKVICLMAMAGFIVGLTVGDVQAKDYKWKISQGIAEDHPAVRPLQAVRQAGGGEDQGAASR